MMNIARRHALAFGLGLAAATLATPSLAQPSYPSKPITIVVAYPAGGDTDALARVFAEKLQSRLGQPVVVDNKPGASGVIGSAYVSKAAPDGYTLLLAPSTFAIAQFVLKTTGSNSYDVLNGFTPIIEADRLPLFLVASPSTGFKTFKDAVDAAKKKELPYASPGTGSPMHILGEMVNKAAGTKMMHVPYRGVAPAVNDVLGGQVPMTYITLGPVAPYLPENKLRVLAAASESRSPLAPNVPTLVELGYKDLVVDAWHGLFAPKGTPAEVVKVLNGHMNEILKMSDVQPRMTVLGATPTGGAPDVLSKTVAADYQRFGKLIKDFGIQAD